MLNPAKKTFTQPITKSIFKHRNGIKSFSAPLLRKQVTHKKCLLNSFFHRGHMHMPVWRSTHVNSIFLQSTRIVSSRALHSTQDDQSAYDHFFPTGSNNSAGGLAPGSGVVDGDPESHVEGQPDDNKNSSKNNSNRKIIPDEARRDRISTAIHRHRSGGVKPDQSGEQSAEKNTGGNSSNELASERRKPGLAVDDPRTDAGYQEDVLNRVTAWVLAVTSPQLAPSIHGDDESIKIDGDGKSTKIDGGKPAKVDLLALLRDGTVLVALVTAIEPETVAAIRRGNDGAEQQPKAEGVTGNNFALSTSALSRGKDLAIFFDACIKLGVPREHHFREQDLLQVAGLERVVHCLAMLWNVTRSTTPERSGPVWRRKTNGVGSISSMHGGLNNARNGDDKYFLS